MNTSTDTTKPPPPGAPAGDTLDPPSIKRIKSGTNFPHVINECYDLKFNTRERTKEQNEIFKSSFQTIRETLESTNSSSEISFGTTRVLAKTNWAKCLSLLLDDDSTSLKALNTLTGKLNPGGGLL